MLNIVNRPSGTQDARFPADAGLLQTLEHLWPYIWPKGRPDLERRAFVCLVLLVIGKLVNAATPFAFKWAADAIDQKGAAAVESVLVGAVGFTILYGFLRVLQALFQQARDALFSEVAMHAVKQLAGDVFVHMHELSLRFHLSRKTGGLTRILERGRDAIETLSRLVMSTGAPTVIEFLFVLTIFSLQFNLFYALVAALTIALYLLYTTIATNWRIGSASGPSS